MKECRWGRCSQADHVHGGSSTFVFVAGDRLSNVGIVTARSSERGVQAGRGILPEPTESVPFQSIGARSEITRQLDAAVAAINRNLVTPDDIMMTVEGLGGSTHEKVLLREFGLLSRFAVFNELYLFLREGIQPNLSSEAGLRGVHRALQEPPRIFAPGNGTIGDVLVYLANNKKAFAEFDRYGDGYLMPVQTPQMLSPQTVVVVDGPLLKAFAEDRELLRRVLDSKAIIFVAGIDAVSDPLGGTRPQSLAPMIAQGLGEVRKRFADEYEEISHGDLLACLDLLSEEWEYRAVNQVSPELWENCADVSAAWHCRLRCSPHREELGLDLHDVASAFFGQGPFGRRELLELLECAYGDLSPDQQSVLFRYIAAMAEVHSVASLGELAKTQREMVVAEANRRGIGEENVLYVVPEPYKSYGVVAALQKRVTGVRANQFLSLREFEKRLPDLDQQSTVVAVLDDVAASGTSLFLEYKRFRTELGFKGPLVISPLISCSSTYTDGNGNMEGTKEAKMFKGFRDLMQKDPNFAYLVTREVPALRDTDFFRGLSSRDRGILAGVLGDNLGYGDQALMVVLPYMAPNNNAIFLSQKVAPAFTLNGRGVKGN